MLALSYNTSQSNVRTADEVASRVARLKQQTGAAEVDVVAHSMGSLSSRDHLKNLGGDAHVDDWVSLGGPNHGTGTAYWCFSTACSQMRPGSSFLTALNSGDETPGAATYVTGGRRATGSSTPTRACRSGGDEHADRGHRLTHGQPA